VVIAFVVHAVALLNANAPAVLRSAKFLILIFVGACGYAAADRDASVRLSDTVTKKVLFFQAKKGDGQVIAQSEGRGRRFGLFVGSLREARQNVIYDFNDKISEQFGDNFKQPRSSSLDKRAIEASLQRQQISKLGRLKS
jgi:hypothetical protein